MLLCSTDHTQVYFVLRKQRLWAAIVQLDTLFSFLCTLDITQNVLYTIHHDHWHSIVTVYCVCCLQVFPGDLLEPTYPESEGSQNLVARSEVDRRSVYFQRLERKLPDGGCHPLVQLLKQCLRNTPSNRPTVEQVVASLEEMKADIEGSYGDITRADAVREVVMKRALSKSNREAREKAAESAGKDVEIHQLQQELEHEQVHV